MCSKSTGSKPNEVVNCVSNENIKIVIKVLNNKDTKKQALNVIREAFFKHNPVAARDFESDPGSLVSFNNWITTYLDQDIAHGYFLESVNTVIAVDFLYNVRCNLDVPLDPNQISGEAGDALIRHSFGFFAMPAYDFIKNNNDVMDLRKSIAPALREENIGSKMLDAFKKHQCYVPEVEPESLTIAYFNAYSIGKQYKEIDIFLHDHQINICLVQETFSKPHHLIPPTPNYYVVRNDVSRKGGGTCIYYRKGLNCRPMEPPLLSFLEVSICRLIMTGHQPITIVSAYVPNRRKGVSSSLEKQQIPDDLRTLLSPDDSVIIAGDFNGKHIAWHCDKSCARGKLLEHELRRLINYKIIAPMDYTSHPYNLNQRSVLDIALLKNVKLHVRSIKTLYELNSDHRPVIIELGSRTTGDDCSRQLRCKLPEHVRQLLMEKNAAVRNFSFFPCKVNRDHMKALQRAVNKILKSLRGANWEKMLNEFEETQQL